MKQILLKDDIYTLVDDEDYEWLIQWKWRILLPRGYVMRSTHKNNSRVTLYIHREIMRPLAGQVVDHINGNKLDNRRENLRVCTQADNVRNRRKGNKPAISAYKGIYWDSRKKRWVARIRFNYKGITLGRFHTEAEAAQCYDDAARKYFGEFARTNFDSHE